MLRGVRGAITVSANQAELLQAAVRQLIEVLIRSNGITVDKIVSVFFTITPDLTALNPAKAARQVFPEWSTVPMLCSQEPMIENMPIFCIRILIHWDSPYNHILPIPAYLGEARRLRPDLF